MSGCGGRPIIVHDQVQLIGYAGWRGRLLSSSFAMADYDNKAFTEKVLTLYAETLRQRLPRVKFMIDDGDGVGDAIRRKVFRIVRDFGDWSVSFPLDEHMRKDGSIDQDILGEAVASGLSEPLIFAANNELEAEENDAGKLLSAPQLWGLHQILPLNLPLGGAQTHFAKDGKMGLFGQTWYEGKTLKSMFEARTVWGLARSGEVTLDIDALRRGDSPL